MARKLGLDEARAVVEAVLTAAAQRNLWFAAAVVDSGGELICLARMDGASPLNARMAVNKAYTATKWLRDTKAIKERLFDMGLGDDGTVLGALGESGGTPAEDEELGQLGAAAFAAL